MFTSKVIVKIAEVKVMKFIYFKVCKERARVQNINHNKLLSDRFFSSEAAQEIKNFNDKRKNMELNQHLTNHKGKNYEYKRLVTVLNNNSSEK